MAQTIRQALAQVQNGETIADLAADGIEERGGPGYHRAAPPLRAQLGILNGRCLGSFTMGSHPADKHGLGFRSTGLILRSEPRQFAVSSALRVDG